MPFDGRRYRVGGLPVEEEYDCIVVGAGISGLGRGALLPGAALRQGCAHPSSRQSRRVRRPCAPKRVPCRGRLLIGYGGSEALQSPEVNFSSTVNA
jgi:spermidine dehydrogenase